jgi:hypothetical protein
MKRGYLLLLVLGLGAGGFLLWRQLFPGPEQQIRRRMTDLRELVSFQATEGNLRLLADTQRLGALFTEAATIRVDVPGGVRGALTGRDSIVQVAAAARQSVGMIEVEFLDVVVTLASDRRAAVVEATAKARQSGTSELWIQELRFHWVRTDDGWQIASVETVRTLTAAESVDLSGGAFSETRFRAVNP